MSYVVDQSPSRSQQSTRKRRWPWLVATVLVAALVAGGAFLAGRWRSPEGHAAGTGAPVVGARTPSNTDSFGTLQWPIVAGEPIPRSPVHGPRQDGAEGTATGYTHDLPGAVLAAINISALLDSTTGPGTYPAVLYEQTYGDLHTALQQLAAQTSPSDVSQTIPDHWWWQITAGNPSGATVQVTLLAHTPQSAAMGGFSQLSRTLAWQNGDWRMQVPAAAPALVTSTAGFTPLEQP